MRRLTRQPLALEITSILKGYGRAGELRLNEDVGPRLVSDITAAFASVRDNPAALFGKRTEEMFAFVVASLGQTDLIVEEDAGQVITAVEPLNVPDYRLVLTDQSQFLVEVKNVHSPDLEEPIRLTRGYLEGLVNYSRLMQVPLKLAVYWSGWNLWTLVPVETATEESGLTMKVAVRANEMATLGDQYLATTAPLSLRLGTNPSEPRSLANDGIVDFTIGSAELYSGGRKVEDPIEQRIGVQLMLYGDWEEHEPEVEFDGDTLISVTFTCAPSESAEGQGFDGIGSLSGIVSRQFRHKTANEGELISLSTNARPGDLGVLIPDGYTGKDLRLWRFALRPPAKS